MPFCADAVPIAMTNAATGSGFARLFHRVRKTEALRQQIWTFFPKYAAYIFSKNNAILNPYSICRPNPKSCAFLGDDGSIADQES